MAGWYLLLLLLLLLFFADEIPIAGITEVHFDADNGKILFCS